MTQQPRPIDAMIVGAQKAGTSSLAYYLGQHPAICTHRRLELSYFVNELDFALGYPANFERYFAHCPPGSRLLGKSVTVMTDPIHIRRMHDHNPQMGVVVVLRNPVDRAYSAYWWARRKGYETLPTFEQALDADPGRHRSNAVRVRSTSYIPFGSYAQQLEGLIDAFPRDRLQIHLFEDLQTDAEAVCRQIFQMLAVDASFVPDVGARRNAGALSRSSALARLLSSQSPWKRALRRALPNGLAEGWKRQAEGWNRVRFDQPPMLAATRARLVRHFEAENLRLGVLIGKDLSAWNRMDAASKPAEES